MIPEPHSLWRCNQCHYSVYEVLGVEDRTVSYRVHHSEDKRVMVMNVGLWQLNYEPLSPDEVLIATGGIF